MSAHAQPSDPRLRAPQVEQLLNESWPRDARTTPDRPPIAVRARVVWSAAGEEWVCGRATRWSGRSVFVETTTRNRCVGVWVDATDVRRLTSE